MSSTEGNCSASLRPRVGPSPGVSDSASQYKDCEIPGLVPDMKTFLVEGYKLRGLYTDCGKSVKSSKAAGGGACAPQVGPPSLLATMPSCVVCGFLPSVFSILLL